jgi:predicted unusual protein kinase regulating ubiquinone biosynthesis (AarF/ABC1/UbiB family)
MSKLKRYKDLAALILKYGRSDLLRSADDEVITETDPHVRETAKDFADDLEALGPTFVKIGQLLSTRVELFPPECLQVLERLQDNVEPFSYAEVEPIVENELGLRMSKAFEEFEAAPIAAASLGQVHRAVLRDGRKVAVKVQRPGIRAQIFQDLESLQRVADLLNSHTEVGSRYNFSEIAEEFRRTLLNELDYRREARNLTTLKENLRGFRNIVVPSAIDDYSTSCVLTMDYIEGRKVTSLGPLARIDLNHEPLADELFEAYLQQILVHGFFHADPHPGNIFLTNDNRIALLDLGMVGRIASRMRENLVQLMLAVSEGHGEETAKVAIKIGRRNETFDEERFVRRVSELVAEYQDLELQEIQVGQIVLQIAYACGDAGLRVPSEFAMLGKTLLNLDQVGRSLDPNFNPNASIRRHTLELTRSSVMDSLSPGKVLNSMIEVKHFLENFPNRVNKILDQVAENKLRVKVDAINEQAFITGLQKIANRITLGLIISALIIGAAQLMKVETSFRILGYPGIAMLFFLFAGCSGLILMANILLHDR